MSKVLIGIISKNRAKILPKAINSALNQSYLNKSIIVFDDNSKDNTSELSSLYTEISWILSKNDNGISKARNFLMQNTDADYFCSLDDDSWFIKEQTLQEAVEFLESNLSVAAISFDMLTPDKPEQKSEKQIIETNTYIGCGHLLRLSVLKEVGFYHSFPGFYGGEEKDLCIRMIDKGYKVIKFRGSYVWHDKTNVNRNISLQHESGVLNDLVFAWIRTPLVILFISVIYKITIHFWFSFKNRRVNLFEPTLKGVILFIRLLLLKKVKRMPVSLRGFKKYQSLSKIK